MGQDGDALGVTILHVSDTQFGTYHRFDSSDSLSSNLIRDLGSLARDGVPPIDLVVVSGDITERGKARGFAQALAFIDEVCAATGLDRDRVVIVPGNHDVSWPLSRSFFDEWSDDHDDDPPPPFFKKWRNYQDFATKLHGPSAFTEDQPYRLQRFDDLRVVVAAMNSTIHESHREADHYGWCGRDQLRWFADQLDAEDLRSTLKVGVLHHNARCKAEADNENLRDEDDLTEIIEGRLDLLLHGHTHEGKEDRLSDGTLVLATGSAAVTAGWRPDETPNQYQVLHIQPGSVTRWARCWDSRRRWMPDLRASRRRDELKVRIDLPVRGWRPKDLRGEKVAAFSALWTDEQDSFARQRWEGDIRSIMGDVKEGKEYDIAVSFAGEQRDYVAQTVAACKALGLRVFYDKDKNNDWWGNNFIRDQRQVYSSRTRYFLPFISAEYLSKPIPMDEFSAAMMTAVKQGDGYILPVLMNDAAVPADLLHPHIGYLRSRDYTPQQLAEQIRQRVSAAAQAGQAHAELRTVVSEALAVRMPKITPDSWSKYIELDTVWDYLYRRFTQGAEQLKQQGLICTVRLQGDTLAIRVERHGKTAAGLTIRKSVQMGDDKLTWSVGVPSTFIGNSFNGWATPAFDRNAGSPVIEVTDMASSFSGSANGKSGLTYEEFFQLVWGKVIEQIERS